jgi:hypothetical protein
MKKIILSFLLFTIAYLSFGQGQVCQQDLFPKQSTNRYWGYVNIFDQWQILPIFTTAQPFRGKTAVVLRGMKYGAVNCKGRLIIPCEYQAMKDFVGGKAWVKKGGLWGLVNDEGKVLLQPIYKEIKEISKYSDQVWVLLQDKWGVYDFDKERFIYKPQFHEVQVLDGKTSLVKTNELSGIIQVDSAQFIYPIQIEKVVKVAPYRLAIQEKGQWGMLTYHGRLLIEPAYDTLFFKYKNLIQVEKGDKVGLTDYKGRIVTPVRFDSIATYHQGGARICQNGLCGFISVRGKLVLPMDFTYADRFSKGLCIAKRKNDFGLINAKNQWMIQDTFDMIKPSDNYNYFVASDEKESYFINSQGEIQTKETFFYIDLSGTTDLVRVKTDGFYLYDFEKNEYVTSVGMDSISAQNRQVFLFKENNKIGVLDTAGKIQTPNLYDTIVIENKRFQYFFIQLNDKWGVRLLNKELVPLVNDSLVFIDDTYLLAKRNGYYGIYKNNGKELVQTKYHLLQTIIEYDRLVWPIIYESKKKNGLLSKIGVNLKLPKHKELRYLQNGLYGYSYKNKWGVLNKKGEILIEAQYYELGVYERGILKVKKNGKWLKVNKQGKKK